MALTKSLKEIIADDKTGLLSKHETWERVSLRDVADVLNGFPFDSKLFHPSVGTPLIRIRDIISGSTDTFYTGEFASQFLVNSGELLIGMDGDFNSARWRSSPSLLNQRVCKITPKENFYSGKLLEYALPGYLGAINAATSSVTVKHLSSRSIEDIELPLPPLKEQTRIVNKLDELISDLNAGVAELKAAQKKLIQYRQSLLKAAVEGELTGAWRAEQEKHGEALETGVQLLERILTERRKRWEEKQLAKFKEQGKKPPKGWQDKYPEPVKPDTTNLSELPKGWVWVKVDHVGNVQLGRQRAPKYHTGDNMVPYLRVANVFEDRIDISDIKKMHFSFDEENTFKLQYGDILLNEGQSLELVGRSAIYRNELPRACFTNTLVRLRTENGVLPEFAQYIFLHYLHSGRFRKIATITTNIAHLGAGRFAEIEFPLPGVEEQKAIVQSLCAEFDRIREQIKAIEHSFKQIAAQRKNILKSAFSGQLVPQDPSDEPASVLLERIRAERETQVIKGKAVRSRKKKEVVHG